jgi:hypothetical protein
MRRPSQLFQKRAAATVSRAFRLPSRAQNRASADFTNTAVGMRGFSRRSEISAMTFAERSKIFSE